MKTRCDTSMHEIFDGVDSNDLRPLLKDAFQQLQRGKAFEKMIFMEGSFRNIANESKQTKRM